MTLAATPELYWLAMTSVLTASLWIPYILRLIVQLGPVQAVWDPTGIHALEAPWAQRAQRAHTNAIENLAVFAPLAILIHITGTSDGTTATAAAIFFYARLSHYLIYVFGLPVVRTVVFLVGFGCQMVLAARLFGLL